MIFESNNGIPVWALLRENSHQVNSVRSCLRMNKDLLSMRRWTTGEARTIHCIRPVLQPKPSLVSPAGRLCCCPLPPALCPRGPLPRPTGRRDRALLSSGQPPRHAPAEQRAFRRWHTHEVPSLADCQAPQMNNLYK